MEVEYKGKRTRDQKEADGERSPKAARGLKDKGGKGGKVKDKKEEHSEGGGGGAQPKKGSVEDILVMLAKLVLSSAQTRSITRS